MGLWKAFAAGWRGTTINLPQAYYNRIPDWSRMYMLLQETYYPPAHGTPNFVERRE